MSAGRAGRPGVGCPGPSLSCAPRSSAVDSRTGAKVAIKKLYRPFQSELFAKRAYRELRLLKHMRHENVSRAARARPRPPRSAHPPPAPDPRPGDPWAALRGGGAGAVGRAVSLSVRGREDSFLVSRPLRLGQSRGRLWLFGPGPACGWPRPRGSSPARRQP